MPPKIGREVKDFLQGTIAARWSGLCTFTPKGLIIVSFCKCYILKISPYKRDHFSELAIICTVFMQI